MYRMKLPRPVPPWKWLALPALAMSLLQGCAALPSRQDAALVPRLPEKEIERNVFAVAPGEDVVGQLAQLKLAKGDTLPDAARHFSLGVNAVSAANPGADVWAPAAGATIVLPLSFVLPDVPRRGIVINLAAMRLFRFKGEGNALSVATFPIGIGKPEKPTPTGRMHVRRKAVRPVWYVPASISEDHRKKGDPLPGEVPPGPENPLGECALYLSKAGYLIHGTNKPASIGLQASNGCLRLYPEDITRLYRDTPVNTPVLIVDQPYLVGTRKGVLYLEAHKPREGNGSRELEQIEARLRKFQEKSRQRLDWARVREVALQARGIPVPISESGHEGGDAATKIVEIERPALWAGQPETPELRLDAWYVLAADVTEEIEARRICAIISHQGPPIPARVLARSNKGGYRVLAGPFHRIGEAENALRRLKIDLEIEGVLVEPVRKI